MTSSQDSSLRPIASFSQAISLVLLLLHLYYYNYGLFARLGFTAEIGDKVLGHIQDTGLFADPGRSKGLAILFLGMALLSSRGRKDEVIRKRRAFMKILIGIVLYFGSSLLLKIPEGADVAVIYGVLTITGFGLVFTGGSHLSRVLRLPWAADDPFGRERSGFPQEERLIASGFSLHLKGSYVWKGR
ncbi:MAG TPA: YWFCY domain-containing protein, partial [Puia sp.]